MHYGIIVKSFCIFSISFFLSCHIKAMHYLDHHLLPELILIHAIDILDYNDIPQFALTNKNLNNVVENTSDYRIDFIIDYVNKYENINNFNKKSIYSNKYGTACSIMARKEESYENSVQNCYLMLIRAQLARTNNKSITYYFAQLVKMNRDNIKNNESKSGIETNQVFINKFDDIDWSIEKQITFFGPRFNTKGDAYALVCNMVNNEPFVEYSLNSKGELKKRDCFIDKNDGQGEQPCIMDSYGYHVISQLTPSTPTIETETTKTFIFDTTIQ